MNPSMDSVNPIEKKLNNDCSSSSSIDLISSMPDSILGKIISYLPTKDAVATSILSKRWKNLFPIEVHPNPINVVLDDSKLLHPTQYRSNALAKTFVRFVNRLFKTTLRDVSSVNELVLKCCHKRYDESRILSWVSSALRLKVRHLVLDVSLYHSKTLLHQLDGCTTLLSLELGKEFGFYLPNINFTLPNLQSIHLRNLIIFNGDEDEKSINEFIAGCPKLENLWFTSCTFRLLGVLHIHSPLLKNLRIDNSLNECKCGLLLDAPNLEVLSYCDCSARNFKFSSFKSLFAVHIDVRPSEIQLNEYYMFHVQEAPCSEDGVAQLVTACSSTTKLSLAASSIEALQRSSLQLPLFQNLTCLSLGCLGFPGWILLARLLWSAPNLESLVFEEGFILNEHESGYAKFMSLMKNIPFCLELHVENIEFWVFKGEEEEINLIEVSQRPVGFSLEGHLQWRWPGWGRGGAAGKESSPVGAGGGAGRNGLGGALRPALGSRGEEDGK
ncbi:hypothetical protein RD792_008867 [Penstemon davidsonii]|uniref:F-box domain-containing protein n=1 Tax=Penstemon davidsonii TaxID=160366 RepID=A0ABR0DAB3_9LAMI|nr:hypothetical protein RD792_008867 [Penstemon davidsonii]